MQKLNSLKRFLGFLCWIPLTNQTLEQAPLLLGVFSKSASKICEDNPVQKTLVNSDLFTLHRIMNKSIDFTTVLDYHDF